MDKITDAFTSRVDSSPSRTSHSRNKYSLGSSTMDETPFPDLVPHREDGLYATLAERRQGVTPAPIQVKTQRGPMVVPHRAAVEHVDYVSPLSPLQMYEAGRAGYQTSSSAYSSANHPSAQPAPLNVQPSSVPINPFRDVPRDTERQLGSPIKFVRRDGAKDSGPLPSALWSPFPFYFRGDDFPSEKKGGKTMFGHDGWLERTEQGADKGKKGSPHKKAGLIESIKKIAKEMVSFTVVDECIR